MGFPANYGRKCNRKLSQAGVIKEEEKTDCEMTSKFYILMLDRDGRQNTEGETFLSHEWKRRNSSPSGRQGRWT